MRKYIPLVVFTVLMCGIGPGCTGPSTPPKQTAAPVAPEKDDADNPLVKEARPDTEAVLDDLLAGRFHDDSMLAHLGQKLNGFQSWSIETQRIDPDLPKGVHFGGTLKGPRGDAAFRVLMVKQQNGKWMIATFSGPNPKE